MLKISRNNVVYAMCPSNKPVLTVEPGTTIEFETADALGGQIQSASDRLGGLDWNRINPATGPVYVNSAEPGDALSVKIEKINIDSKGVVMTGKDMGVFGHILSRESIKIVPIEGGFAAFSDKISLPLNKMVGVIGTAPKTDAIPTGVPCTHGGNMDCKEIREGVTLLLPVYVPGALLAMGDIHAVMADGEVGVTGVEIAGSVVVTIDVLKHISLPSPMLFSDSHVMTVASNEDLDKAVESAVMNMADYLVYVHDFPQDEAAMLLSLAGDVRICQVVVPKKTARVELLKKYLPHDCI